MKPQLIIILVFAISFCQAQESITRYYEISYGSRPNIESGAESLLSISSLAFDRLNYSIEKIDSKGLRFSTRFLNFTIAQLYSGGLLYGMLLHEHFGHLSRAKEFGLPLRLQYNFPGLGGDFTFPVNQSVPVIQRQMVLGSGYEASAYLAYKATQKLYEDDWSGSYIGLYLLAGKLIEGTLTSQNDIKPFLNDPNKYYANDTRLSRNPTPNDPLAYILALIESYGYYSDFIDKERTWVEKLPDMTLYTQNEFIHDQNKRIKRAFALSALDPSLLYFLKGTYSYLAKGKGYIKPFMFKIREVSFMPSVRANYGELGIENYFDLFLKVPNSPFMSIYYRSGGNMFDLIKGGGFEMKKITTGKFSTDGQFDYWKNERENTNNFNLFAKTRYKIPNSAFLLVSAAGYKSKGSLIGKPFGSGFYGYVGLGLLLNTLNNSN